MQKRLCKFALAALTALLLAGCNGLPTVTTLPPVTTVAPETTAVPETTVAPETTEVVTTPEESTAPPETTVPLGTATPLETTEPTATETTPFAPVSVPEESGLRRVENFIFLDPETPEYRLAELLYLHVPPVVKTEEVTETVAVETTEVPPETTEETTVPSETAEETTSEPPVTVTYEVEGSAAIYYQDLTDGEAFAFAPDKTFFCASMIKAVYVYALLQQADAGEIDLAEKIVYTKDMFVEGSGNFSKVEDGTEFTVRKLISQTVRYSDNTAYSMLQDRFGTAFFKGVMERDGLTPTRYGAWWRTNARNYGAFFAKLYAYFASESENGAWLCEEMQKSTQTVMLQRALAPDPVAHKYGWDEDSYCDGAVVLGDHPYVVIFLSNMDEGHMKYANTRFIYDVGGIVKQLHEAKYAAETTSVSEDPS